LPVFLRVSNFPLLNYYLILFIMPANSLAGVFIYYYTLFVTERREKLTRKDIINFLLFIFILIAYIKFKKPDFNIFPLPTPLMIKIIIGFGIIVSVVYNILALIKIKKYSKIIKDYFSDIKGMEVNWLNNIIYFSILSSFSFAICLWLHSVLNVSALYAVTFDLGLFIVILFILMFYIINQTELSRESREVYSGLKNLNLKNDNSIHKKYERVNLNINEQKKYLILLNEYMEKNKPYLIEEITFKEISEEINLPYHHLSLVINNLLKKNFYDFINEYRIQEVLNILNKSKNEAVNILTIAFKCGFNSKSTFNRVFKNKMGVTPSKYKNNRNII
jgi:AraC-like DNA-binding protein